MLSAAQRGCDLWGDHSGTTFFEIYRSSGIPATIGRGILTSAALTVSAGIMGFVLAILLANARHHHSRF